MGGNSLTDAAVTGKLAGEGAGDYAASRAAFGSGKRASELAQKWQVMIKEIVSGSGEPNKLYSLREEFGRQNWDNMGILEPAKNWKH